MKLLSSLTSLDTLMEIFLFSVALAVAAVPEALPAVITGSLAIGMCRIEEIERKLGEIETKFAHKEP